MIRRDTRNIGKRVLITDGSNRGHYAVVRGFRGDVRRGVPWVFVQIYSNYDGHLFNATDYVSGALLETSR